MDLQVLISTMNINSQAENETLLKHMNVQGNSLTVSQTHKSGKENNLIYDNKIGLSRSRNIAINNAACDILLIADDDVVYNDNYEETIKQAYKENPEADMIAFYVESMNPKRKVRKLRSGKIGWIRIFRVSSFQLTFKANSIKGMKFDENFGAGTDLFCGEETIFLSECLRKKMKLIYIDKKIGKVKQEKSTWYTGINKKFMNVQKQIFKRISPKFWWFLYIQFIIRKIILGKIKHEK